tara:strand:+ start:361 stop:1119 length:759 start_codon:yes stop_codon:yes gene_type:complete
MTKSLVATLISLLFSTLLFAQNVGDSIQIISYSNRTYSGEVYKIEKDGYFIKGNYGTIFLNKNEIKEYQIFKDQVVKQNNSLLIGNTNEDSTKIEGQTSKELTNNNQSEFYKKYDLKNLNISNYNNLNNYLDYKLFVIETLKHVRKNKQINRKDKRKFPKNLNLELQKKPNQEYLKYNKRVKIGGGLLGTSLITETIGIAMLSDFNFDGLTVMAIGLVPYTIGSFILLKSTNSLYKSFFIYLKDQSSDMQEQ